MEEAEGAPGGGSWRQPASQAAAFGLVKLLDGRGRRGRPRPSCGRFVAAAPTPRRTSWRRRGSGKPGRTRPRAGAKTLRVALTGTGTLTSLGAHLRVACAGIGLHPALYVGEFGQWAQDLLAAQQSRCTSSRPN